MVSSGPGPAGLIAAAAALALAAGPAAAQFEDDEAPLLPSLPTTLRATVRVPVDRAALVSPADTLVQLYPALAACWDPPPGLGRGQVTLRLSLTRDGRLAGVPRVTFASLPPERRRPLVEAAQRAVRACTPVALTAALGGAVAGRPIALRFVYSGEKETRHE
ncbi:hypothetical protein M446_4461 [Methylobacterium sp. 4-46]|uniref:hypothetical protein n=1 Tax=unclassified Methylobacterium TaxID=2615210 RepID=UPI000152CDB4|nr:MULTISPECIES: hypothetical protein [Methylobacterium]ACA18802.1 hypothetical protein M446_4461 [Methylobacterium sp. 4-46]WFT78029.1 hypothetical protein QA634_22385 [Methylobacterium nodulans]